MRYRNNQAGGVFVVYEVHSVSRPAGNLALLQKESVGTPAAPPHVTPLPCCYALNMFTMPQPHAAFRLCLLEQGVSMLATSSTPTCHTTVVNLVSEAQAWLLAL